MTIFIGRARLRYGRIGEERYCRRAAWEEAGVAMTPEWNSDQIPKEVHSYRGSGYGKCFCPPDGLCPISTRTPLLLGSYHGDDFAPGLSQYQARAGSNG